jgi:hypothetical protein
MLVASVAKYQERTAAAYSIGHSTAQRTLSETKPSLLKAEL